MKVMMAGLVLFLAGFSAAFAQQEFDRRDTLYATQVPFGEGASVSLTLNNDTAEEQRIRLLFQVGRDFVNVLVDGEAGQPYASSPRFTLGPDEKRTFRITSNVTIPVRYGYVEIENTGGVTGSVTRNFEGEYRTLLSKNGNRAVVRSAIYTRDRVTGLALTNVNLLPGADALITLRVFGKEGLLVTTKKLDRLESSTQRALFLNELLKGDPEWDAYLAKYGEFRGELEFSADGVFFAVASINLRY